MGASFTVAVVLSVKPVLGMWQAILSFAALFVWLLCQRLAAADLSELEQLLGAAVLEALERAHLPVKVAAPTIGMDESNFRKALRGEPGHHISLTRLVRLPLSFWSVFLPSLSYLVVKLHVTQIIEDAKSLRRQA